MSKSAQEKKATVYDIARRAGVSASTVSRILNGSAKWPQINAKRLKMQFKN